MTYTRILIWVTALIVLGACSERRYSYQPPPRPIVVEPPPAQVKPLPPTDVYVPKPPSPEKQKPITKALSPAVIALMDEAESLRQVGNLDSAVATIERAVRIQPRNAQLWHQLAVLRMQQDKPRLALDLAKKSNSLVGSDHQLMRENWLLISKAKRMLGDDSGAESALFEADS